MEGYQLTSNNVPQKGIGNGTVSKRPVICLRIWPLCPRITYICRYKNGNNIGLYVGFVVEFDIYVININAY